MTDAMLKGRRALVTGSVQGIGLGIAQALARQGCAIVLHGLAAPAQAQEARALVLEAGAPAVEVLTHDLREAAQVQAMMENVLSAPLDILVNNAGIQHTAPLAEMPRAKWDEIIAINLSAAFDTMRLALPGMAQRGYGRVVNISSVHGLVASVNKAPYVAAKFALVGMSRVAALEYASAGSRESGGVTVNCICPGWTETAIIQPQIDARAQQLGTGREEAIRDLLKEKQPSLRTSLPSEIARLVCWLCEPAAHNGDRDSGGRRLDRAVTKATTTGLFDLRRPARLNSVSSALRPSRQRPRAVFAPDPPATTVPAGAPADTSARTRPGDRCG